MVLEAERESTYLERMVSSQRDTQRESLDTIVMLRGEQLRNYVADYSLWNDMASFAQAPDPSWAKVNIDASLTTFKMSYVWVFGANGQLAYHTGASAPLMALPGWQGGSPAALFGAEPFVHYFTRLEDGALIELRGAWIQREDDTARTSQPLGFFFAAKRWDDAYVAEFARLTGAAVRLEQASESCAPTSDMAIVVKHELRGREQAQPAGQLCAAADNPLSKMVTGFHRTTRDLSVAFAFLLVGFLCITLHLLIVRPLRLITGALASGSSAAIERLRSQSNEFGELAEVTHQYQQSILERDKLRAQVYQTSKLASLSVLGAGLAHELNNPLASVLGHADMLLAAASDGALDPEETREAASVIVAQAMRMRAVMDHVRAFNQYERGLEPDCTVPLSRVLVDGVSLLRKELTSRKIQLHIDVPEGLGAAACDTTKLSAVLRNLVLNAADAFDGSPEGRTKTVRIEARAAQGVGTVRVIDNGPGIPEAIRDKVFEPFFSTKPVGKGTGLGLWIVHGIVEEWGGNVTFESSAAGTAFQFTLCLVAIAPPATPSTTTSVHSSRPAANHHGI